MGDDAEALRARLNGETGRIAWSELERHFARGRLVTVAPERDLVEIAARFAEDDRDTVAEWLQQGTLVRTTDSQASRWAETDASLWSVVVPPWILVQEAD